MERQLREQPPRNLSIGTRITILFSGIFAQIGWGILGFGMIFAYVFVANSDLRYALSFDGEWTNGTGIVTTIEMTNSKENNNRIYSYTFRYQAGGEEQTSTSYGQQSGTLSPNSPVEIEYKSGNPKRAHIKGMRGSMFSSWVAFVLIFPFIGFVFVVASIILNKKTILLLRDGCFTRGKLVDKEKTAARVNREIVYKYSFEFETQGKKYIAQCSTHQEDLVEDEAQEMILYLPDNPAVSIVYDGVTGAPNINSQGQLENNVKFIYWILPFVAIAINVIGLLISFL